jgi:hypothetical protein
VTTDEAQIHVLERMLEALDIADARAGGPKRVDHIRVS